MEITTIIIGKDSNLSSAINTIIPNSILISSRELCSDITILSKYKNLNLNIIFNNFQQSVQLGNLNNSTMYIENSIVATAKVLDYFRTTNIRKIIYTSSSSVYGSNIFCSETDTPRPLNLHASLKLSNEKLIERYCSEYDIDYTITRVFNMYGGNDKFSVISKVLKCALDKKNMSIVNNGNAVRDFIHIDDVVFIYQKLLKKKNINVVNIGTGDGISIKSILDFMKNKSINLKIDNIEKEELKVSTANTTILKKIIGKHIFVNIEDYLSKELII